MDSFESLLKESYTTLEHFVKFKIYSRQDAEDIIQNVCLSACCKFSTLKDPAVFKSWLLSIARNKCNDYFREKARSLDIPLDALAETALVTGRYGPAERSVVRETLDLLGSRDKQILYLYYFKELPQDEIARRLNIPNGTVKSRLHYPRKNFKEKYPHTDISKGGITVKSVPKKIYYLFPCPHIPLKRSI